MLLARWEKYGGDTRALFASDEELAIYDKVNTVMGTNWKKQKLKVYMRPVPILILTMGETPRNSFPFSRVCINDLKIIFILLRVI